MQAELEALKICSENTTSKPSFFALLAPPCSDDEELCLEWQRFAEHLFHLAVVCMVHCELNVQLLLAQHSWFLIPLFFLVEMQTGHDDGSEKTKASEGDARCMTADSLVTLAWCLCKVRAHFSLLHLSLQTQHTHIACNPPSPLRFASPCPRTPWSDWLPSLFCQPSLPELLNRSPLPPAPPSIPLAYQPLRPPCPDLPSGNKFTK